MATNYTLKNLNKAVVQAESGGDPKAVSSKGALGRYQVMPETAKNPGFGITPAKNSSDKELSRVGKAYLEKMIKRYGQEGGLVAYNWGPGNAEKWIKGGQDKSKLPKETQNYLIKVGNLASKYKKGRGKTTMASKNTIAKGLKKASRGRPHRSPFRDIARLKKLRVAEIILKEPNKKLSERDRQIGNQLLKKLKKDGRTLKNFVKLEGRPDSAAVRKKHQKLMRDVYKEKTTRAKLDVPTKSPEPKDPEWSRSTYVNKYKPKRA